MIWKRHWPRMYRNKKMTLLPESFFFMSPYRSFRTAGCFSRFFSHSAADGALLDGEFQRNMAGRVH